MVDICTRPIVNADGLKGALDYRSRSKATWVGRVSNEGLWGTSGLLQGLGFKVDFRQQNQVVRGSRSTTESEAEEKFTSLSLTDS